MIKEDFKHMFDDLYAGTLDIKRLNYGIITLVPKTKEANQIQKFRPVCLLNVSFNFFTKVLMNTLNLVASSLIPPLQIAFVKGRYSMEGGLVLHEALNSVHVKKQSALLLKVDFEKAYDKIKWPFVMQMLKGKGFPDKWID